jgi:hypothetical protein
MERRTGFYRRKNYPVLGTIRDNPWILAAVLVLLNVLSLIDGLFTASELALGVAVEGNPVLGAALRQHPLLAVVIKVGAMLLVSVVIWRGRKTRAILAVSVAALALYAALVAYHVGSLRGLGLL